MDEKILQNIELKFTDYAKSFYTDDDFVNFNLNLKLCHSYRVRSESALIAENLNLTDKQKILAETIGILHDIGRFPQFTQYKTYRDDISVNHGLLGHDEIIRTNIIKSIEQPEQEVILKAVKYHGAKEIPDDFTGELLLQSQIIRDADKIDIFRVVLGAYRLRRENPDNYLYDVEYPENGPCSPEIINAIKNGQKIDYSLIKNLNDARLLQLGWVFDINFKASFQRILEKGYLDELISYLPKTAEVKSATEFVLRYVKDRING